MRSGSLKDKESANENIKDSDNRLTEIARCLPHQRTSKSDQSNTRSHPNSV